MRADRLPGGAWWNRWGVGGAWNRDHRQRAARLSFWLPGLGQLYLGRWLRGMALIALSWLSSDLAWRDCSAAWTVAALAVWAVAVGDARRDTACAA